MTEENTILVLPQKKKQEKNYCIDCEFIEDGKTIELISIGIVAETGETYYAVSLEFDPRKANEWVQNNVFPTLPIRPLGTRFDQVPKDTPYLCTMARRVNMGDPSTSPTERSEALKWKTREQIRLDLIKFFGCDESPEEGVFLKENSFSPVFWGEWCSYDWVAFCQLFGEMVDLPKGFPMRINDLVQTAKFNLNVPYDSLGKNLETEGHHNALLGAITVKSKLKKANCILREKQETTNQLLGLREDDRIGLLNYVISRNNLMDTMNCICLRRFFDQGIGSNTRTEVFKKIAGAFFQENESIKIFSRKDLEYFFETTLPNLAKEEQGQEEDELKEVAWSIFLDLEIMGQMLHVLMALS